MPHLGHHGPKFSRENVHAEATVVRIDGTVSDSDGLIRSDAFTPAVLARDAQINRSGALERYMPPLCEMP